MAANIDEPVIFLSPEEVVLSKGDKVRITDGVFMGVEGTFMRVKNTRDRRVVVKIDGIQAGGSVQYDETAAKDLAQDHGNIGNAGRYRFHSVRVGRRNMILGTLSL